MTRKDRNVLLRLLEDYPHGVRLDRIPDGNGRCHRNPSPSLSLTIGLLTDDGLIVQASDPEGWLGYALSDLGRAALAATS